MVKLLLITLLISCGKIDIPTNPSVIIGDKAPERIEIEEFQTWWAEEAEHHGVQQATIDAMLNLPYEIVESLSDESNDTNSVAKCIRGREGEVSKVVLTQKFFESDRDFRHVGLMYITGVCLNTVRYRLRGGWWNRPADLTDILANPDRLADIAQIYDTYARDIEAKYFEQLKEDFNE